MNRRRSSELTILDGTVLLALSPEDAEHLEWALARAKEALVLDAEMGIDDDSDVLATIDTLLRLLEEP